jgi:hypothetical protein
LVVLVILLSWELWTYSDNFINSLFLFATRSMFNALTILTFSCNFLYVLNFCSLSFIYLVKFHNSHCSAAWLILTVLKCVFLPFSRLYDGFAAWCRVSYDSRLFFIDFFSWLEFYEWFWCWWLLRGGEIWRWWWCLFIYILIRWRERVEDKLDIEVIQLNLICIDPKCGAQFQSCLLSFFFLLLDFFLFS